MMSRYKAKKSAQQITVECHDIFEVCCDTIRKDNFIVATKVKAAEGELCRNKDQVELRNRNYFSRHRKCRRKKQCHDIRKLCYNKLLSMRQAEG